MSSFGRFEPVGGLKGTLPGGIFAPLSVEQRNSSTMTGQRSSLRSQPRAMGTKISPALNAQDASRELDNFDDIASSRPVPLTALSMRTNSRNKGSKNWKPFPRDDTGDGYVGDPENSMAFSGATQPRVPSHLSVSYNPGEAQNLESVSIQYPKLSSSHIQDQPLGVTEEAKRQAWPRAMDTQIQQNPLSYSAGFDAYRNAFLQQPRNTNLLNRPNYSGWPPSVPDESVTIGRVQHDRSFVSEDHFMPESLYHVHEPSVYNLPHYRPLPHQQHYHNHPHHDPTDFQYAPALQYPLSHSEYGQYGGYGPVPSERTFLEPASGVPSLASSSLLHGSPSHMAMPVASPRRSADPIRASTPTKSRSLSPFERALIEEAEREEAERQEAIREEAIRMAAVRKDEVVERKKKALRDAVLRKIEQDELEQRWKIEAEIKRQREKERKIEEERKREEEQKLKQISETPSEAVTSPHDPSNPVDGSTPVESKSSGSGGHSIEEAGKEETIEKSVPQEAVPAMTEADEQEQMQKIGRERKQGLKTDGEQPGRTSVDENTQEAEKDLVGTENGHSSPRLPNAGHIDEREPALDESSQQDDAKAQPSDKHTEAAETTLIPQTIAPAGRALRSPPGLPKPASYNPAIWTQSFEEYRTPGSTRLEEANDWFHKDGRGEEQFRQQVASIADEYANKCEESGGPSYSKEDKETSKQMTLLMGDAVANLKSYMDGDDKDQQSDYFANFRTVEPRYCEPRHGAIRSYFHEDPARGQWRVPSGRAVSAVGNKSTKKVLVNRPHRSQGNDKNEKW